MLSGKTILVADDSRVMRHLVRSWLEKLGASVVERDNGAAALLTAQDPKVDAAFCDVNMPHLSGLAVLERVLTMRPDFPLVLLTTLGAEEDLQRGERLGAAAYLTKPLGYGALHSVIRALFGEEDERATPERSEPSVGA